MIVLRRFLVCLFALALLAGPVAAVCGDCCPKAVAQASLASPEACCGDCEPSVERGAPDPSFLVCKSTAPRAELAAVLAPAPAAALVCPSLSNLAAAPSPRSSRLSFSLPPLRL